MKKKHFIIKGSILMVIICALWYGYVFQKEQAADDMAEAIRQYDTDEVRRLLGSPFLDINAYYDNYLTLLDLATHRGYTDIVEILLSDSNIDVNKGDDFNIGFPLQTAAREGYLEIAKLLLASPHIDVNQANKSGHTALYSSIRNGHSEMVKLLLSAPDIDVNQPDLLGRPPIYFAVEAGNTEIVKQLLDFPLINTTFLDEDGNSLRELARKKGHTQIEKLLQKRGL